MQTVTIPQALEVALQHHKAGRLAEAEGIYRQILEVQPEYPDALHFLGVIAHQSGNNDLAVQLIRRAIGVNPQVASYHSNLGNALSELDRLDEAVIAYHRAIELNPAYTEPHNNLGTALKDQGRLDEAIASFREALKLRPDYAGAHNNLGTALKDQGQLDEAIASFRTALHLDPAHCEIQSNLGNALRDKGQFDEAIAAHRRAIQLKPDFAKAHNNLGAALKDHGQLDEAITAFRRALQLKPDYAEALSNLGNALMDKGDLGEAITAHRRALQFKPDYAEVHNNLGAALREMGYAAEAVAACRRAIELKPDYVTAHSNLLLNLHYLPDCDAGALFREHRRWDEIHAQPLARFIEPHRNDLNPGHRLRIGYVSPDFREHSVAFFIEGLLAHHDRKEVETFCYADVFRADPFTVRLQQHTPHWRNITGMSDAQAAELIRQDQIDILVDLSGHTARNRLLIFARKPAPVQITYLGYPDTTGVSTMDYRLTDAYADPPGATEHVHSEKLVRLPDIFACFRPAEDSPPVGPLPALANGHVTFASFHALAKLNEPLMERWAGILRQVTNSRLLMIAYGSSDGSHCQRFIDFLGRNGIEAHRLEFKGRQSLRQYLALHNEVDLLLDSYPFSGHTVGCHALWMGVPVVTLAGERHCSRMVASVLANLGLPELVARTTEEYVKIATELAGDVPRLAELRSTLRERMQVSTVMDAPRFARNVEHAYREMWRARCAGESS